MDRGFLSNVELRTPLGFLFYAVAVIILLAIAVVTLFPFLFAFTSGLKTSTEVFDGLKLFPANAQWQNYSDVWTRFEMPKMFANSLFVVGGGVFFRVLVSAMAAFSLSKLKPVGGKYISLGFLLTLMIPSMAYFVPLFTTISKLPVLNISLVGSYWGLWLPYCVDAFGIFVLKTFFDRIPADLLDAARVDGASALQLLRHIILPLSRSILIVLCVLSFVSLWRDFLLPYLVLPSQDMRPITVRLFYIADNYSFNLQMAASFLALLPPLIIAIVLQRYMKAGLTLGGITG